MTAGTGRTTALVGEVTELLRSGRAAPAEICVVTADEAGAATLRGRIAAVVEEAARARPDERYLTAAHRALDDLVVDTVAGLAGRILDEHAVVAGVPPGFEVLDDATEHLDFEERFDRFAEHLLSGEAVDAAPTGPSLDATLVMARAMHVGHDDLAATAAALHRHRARLEDGGLDLLQRRRSRAGGGRTPTAAPVLAALDQAHDLLARCTDPLDRLHDHLTTVVAEARARLGRCGDDATTLQVLDALPNLATTVGQQASWSGRVDEVRAACATAQAARLEILRNARHTVAAELGARLAQLVVTTANERRAEGRLSKVDVLLHTRRLLRHDPHVVDALRRRYHVLVVDDVDALDALGRAVVAHLAGALDVAIGVDVDCGVSSVANHRSVPGIVAFLNAVATELETGTAGSPVATGALRATRRPLPARAPSTPGGVAAPVFTWGAHPQGQPSVQLSLDGTVAAAAAERRGAGGPTAGATAPPVVVLGGPGRGPWTALVRVAAAELADAVASAVGEGWAVADDAGAVRPARWADVALLVPDPEAWEAMEHAFDVAGVPCHLADTALLWRSAEVRDVVQVLRAADEPSDPVAVVAALRTPALACGDDDLVTWALAGGGWDPLAPPPAGSEDHPVALALTIVADLHRGVPWWGPADVVRQALAALGSLELCLVHRHPHTRSERLLWLASEARRFERDCGGTLRRFLQHAELQARTDLGPQGSAPEPAPDAVRVSTVLGAAGLEFPVVVVAGADLWRSPGRRPPPVVWAEDATPELRLGHAVTSAGYGDAAACQRRREDRGRAGLLWSAMARARDHLVVALHHRHGGDDAEISPAARLYAVCARHPELWRRPALASAAATARGPERCAPGDPGLDESAQVAALRDAFFGPDAAPTSSAGTGPGNPQPPG